MRNTGEKLLKISLSTSTFIFISCISLRHAKKLIGLSFFWVKPTEYFQYAPKAVSYWGLFWFCNGTLQDASELSICSVHIKVMICKRVHVYALTSDCVEAYYLYYGFGEERIGHGILVLYYILLCLSSLKQEVQSQQFVLSEFRYHSQ